MITVLLIVVLSLGLLGLGVYGMVWAEKKRFARKKQAILAAGFQAVDNPDPSLLAPLISLYTKRESQKLSLRHMYQRRENDYLLYLYEVWTESDEGQDLQEEWGLAMASPYLNLPRFTLIPKIDSPGKFANLVNRLMEKVTVLDNVKVEFEDQQQFSRRYLVTGKDESAVRQLFSNRLLNRLQDTSYLQVDGHQNFLTFSKYDLKRKRRDSKKDKLSERLEEACSLFQFILQEAAVR